jgi:hypothetical protein
VKSDVLNVGGRRVPVENRRANFEVMSVTGKLPKVTSAFCRDAMTSLFVDQELTEARAPA